MSDLFKHLLLATEHTRFDTGAERLAIAMAQRCQMPLAMVLPLVSNPEYESLAPQIAARAERLAADNIAQLQAAASEAGVTLTVTVRRGEEPYREIVQQAVDLGTDLIIIRRRGQRSFLANLLVGEMVSKVVAHAPCHVLIAPQEAGMWQNNVLAAAEDTPYGRVIVAMAIAVAAQCGIGMHLVSVIPAENARAQTQAFLDAMADQARQQGVSARTEIRTGKPYTAILEAASSNQCDLIVIGSRSETTEDLAGSAPGRRAWLGAVAQKVMGLSKHPVLVLRS